MYQKLIFAVSFLLLCTAGAFIYLENSSTPAPVSTVFPLNDMSGVAIGTSDAQDVQAPDASFFGANASASLPEKEAVSTGTETVTVTDASQSQTTLPTASDKTEPNTQASASSVPAPLPKRKIRISKEACRRLKTGSASVPADYQPGVSATGQTVASADYQPGVSVTGDAVVPADLNGGYDFPSVDLQDIELPISVDLSKNFPFFQSSLDMGSIPVGNVTFKNGRVYMNGHPLTNDAANILKEQCP